MVFKGKCMLGFLDNSLGFKAQILLFLALLFCDITLAQQTGYPRVTGYASVTHPIATWNTDGMSYNLEDNYTVIFPIGLNLMKSERFGFSFELAPSIKADRNSAKVTSILFHPGAVFRFDRGVGLNARLAFDTNGRFGFTPVFTKTVIRRKDHSYAVSLPFPFRFGAEQPFSVGSGLQLGVSF